MSTIYGLVLYVRVKLEAVTCSTSVFFFTLLVIVRLGRMFFPHETNALAFKQQHSNLLSRIHLTHRAGIVEIEIFALSALLN